MVQFSTGRQRSLNAPAGKKNVTYQGRQQWHEQGRQHLISLFHKHNCCSNTSDSRKAGAMRFIKD